MLRVTGGSGLSGASRCVSGSGAQRVSFRCPVLASEALTRLKVYGNARLVIVSFFGLFPRSCHRMFNACVGRAANLFSVDECIDDSFSNCIGNGFLATPKPKIIAIKNERAHPCKPLKC